MSLLSINYPALIHPSRHCRNGLFPEVEFFARAVAALNHILGYRHKLLYRRVWPLGTAGGSSGVYRWYCKTGYGTRRLVVFPVLGFDDHAAATDPYISVDITKVGGATTTLEFHGGAANFTTVDAPEQLLPQMQWCDVDAASEYTGAVTFNDNVRVLSINVFEEYVPTVDGSTPYFSEWSPSAGSPIYDARIEPLLTGVGALVRGNMGLRFDWTKDDGTARTRTSATQICLIDDATASLPTAATPGVTFDTRYLNTAGVTTVPIKVAVFGSCPNGTGTVKLRNTAGTDAASVSVSGAAGWFTNTGGLAVGATTYESLYFASDGTHSLSVYAVSLYAIQ